jgi:two-component sensor histidine kinase
VVGELVTNALKHAFPGERRGTLQVRLERLPAERLQLTVKDDGVGLTQEWGGRQKSLGLDLVSIFAKQLEATVEVEREGGTCFRLIFQEGSA